MSADDQFVSNLVDGFDKTAEADEDNNNTIQELINTVAADAETQKEAMNKDKIKDLVEDEGYSIREAVKHVHPNASDEEVADCVEDVAEDMGYDGKNDYDDSDDNPGSPEKNAQDSKSKHKSESNHQSEENENKEDKKHDSEENESKEDNSHDSEKESSGIDLFDILYKDAEGNDSKKEKYKKMYENGEITREEYEKYMQEMKNKKEENNSNENKEAYTEKQAKAEAIALVANQYSLS